MPRPRAPHTCADGTCTTPAPAGQARCSRHTDTRSGSRGIYDQRAWKRRARDFLNRNPVCVDCGAPSEHADHEPPRHTLIAQGVTDPDADRWLQPRCHSCHSRKTALHDGGFGRPRAHT